MATRSRKKSSQPTKSPVVRQATKKPASKPKAAAKPQPASPEPAPAPKTRGMVERAGGAQIRRITAYLPPELAKRLALFAVQHLSLIHI